MSILFISNLAFNTFSGLPKLEAIATCSSFTFSSFVFNFDKLLISLESDRLLSLLMPVFISSLIVWYFMDCARFARLNAPIVLYGAFSPIVLAYAQTQYVHGLIADFTTSLISTLPAFSKKIRLREEGENKFFLFFLKRWIKWVDKSSALIYNNAC